MKTFSVYLLSFFTVIAVLTACGPSEQEQQQQREQAGLSGTSPPTAAAATANGQHCQSPG